MEISFIVCNILVSALVSWFISGCMGSVYLKENDRKWEKTFDEITKVMHEEFKKLRDKK